MVPQHVTRVTRSGPGDAADAGPEKVRAGSGAATVWNAFTDRSGRFHAGHWRGEIGALSVAYAEDELCVILEGRVRLSDARGAVEFGPGDAFVVAAGFAGIWETLEPVLKIYAILDPAA